MTVIFVTYHDFRSNSSIQVFSIANCMVGMGHSVHVCIPDGIETTTLPGTPRFSCTTYAEALSRPSQFGRTAADTVIHAWTPREKVRKFTQHLGQSLGCPVIVHLEDNEDIVTASMLGCDPDQMLAQPEGVLDPFIPPNFSHPRRCRDFLQSASGVTHLIDRLTVFVPPGKPSMMFWPAHNREIFHEMPLLLEERRRLGIADHEKVLAYTGNVTEANRQEVASLYLAVVILRRQGYPARLLRTGRDYIPLFEGQAEEISAAVISLGQLAHHGEIPKVLGMADFFVQPGRADPYNDFRFPSKLPEFFSIGRPVLLPYTNLGRFVRDGIDAVVLREGHAMEIADRLVELIRDPAKCEHLSRGALAFCKLHFDWNKAATALIAFYDQIATSAETAHGVESQ